MIKDLIIELLKIYFRKNDHLIIRHCFLFKAKNNGIEKCNNPVLVFDQCGYL